MTFLSIPDKGKIYTPPVEFPQKICYNTADDI